MNKFHVALALALLAPTSHLVAAAPASGDPKQSGLAAIYSNRLNGHRTASGQVYHSTAMTAAHQTLPFGTKVRVTNVNNHKTAVVHINDRGPVQSGRILDLSPAAAHKLGIHKKGLTHVELEVLETGTGKTHHHHG
jgi:rare lipoprotein A